MSHATKQPVIALLLANLLTGSLLAQSGWSVADLTARVREAQTQFRPVTEAEAGARKQAVLKSLAALDASLTQNLPDAAGELRTYLRRDELGALLEKSPPDLKALQEIRALFYTRQAGLELAEARRVREDLSRYIDAARMSSDPRFAETFPAQMEELAQRLERYAAEPTTDHRLALGQTLGWLERAGQAPDIVRDVRAFSERPNLYAEVSRQLIASGLEQPVAEVDTVRDNILGTSLRGTARMTGQVSVKLVPNDDHAVLDIYLAGRALSNNVGQNGPVTIYSTGVSRIWARKRVHIGSEGLSGDSAVADVSTSSNINRIAANCGLVRHIARNRASKSKSQAERIASSRAERRVAGRFNSRVGEMIAEANARFQDKFRDPLLRRDAMPNVLRLSTAEDRLSVMALRAGVSQLGSPDMPPPVHGQYDLSLRIHDSLVGNVGETLIGGETLTDEGLVELLEDAELEVPEELKIGPDSDPWSITFSTEQPLSIVFGTDTVTIALQGREFTRGSQRIRDLIRISATYQAVTDSNGVRLVRDGEVSVDYVQRKSLSAAMAATKAFFRNKFDALFKAEIDPRTLTLPGRWADTGDVALTFLQSGNGWLSLGWTQQPEAPTQDPVATREPSMNQELAGTP